VEKGFWRMVVLYNMLRKKEKKKKEELVAKGC
jgi:hypothetical protein